ncbi:Fic/DOC family protein [Arthrobacter sp. RCC_34]|uniref:Fic/DOC family protein n=1 Tax=Arthrobacter sp. RCC_34 TaxID=3239230 RepID=UPI003523C00D
MGAAEDWEAYLYPVEETQGPGRVLRNNFEEKSLAGLMIYERSATALRQRQLSQGVVKIPQTFDAEHVRRIHGHLFQDVYPWAGQFRNVDISKRGQPFAAVEDMGAYLDVATEFARGARWGDMTHEEFARSISVVFAYTNTAHPFREGTGRTTKQLLRDVAALSPYRLDFDDVDKTTWNAMARASMPAPGGDGHPQLEEAIPLFRTITVRREAMPAQVDEYAQIQDLVRVAFDNTKFRAALGGVTRPEEASPTLQRDQGKGYGRS